MNHYDTGKRIRMVRSQITEEITRMDILIQTLEKNPYGSLKELISETA